MRRIPSLDGVRACAITLVVLGHGLELHYHSAVAGALANLGVRVFFVLSGYLITTLLLTEHSRTGAIDLRAFYTRRAFRILPAAVAYMLIIFAVLGRETSWYHMLLAALYLTNFDYTHPWFLGHLWSLSVEEQFYFLWPAVLRRWHRYRTGILLGVVALAPLYRVGGHFLGAHGRLDETFPAVADILAVGCLLAIWFPKLPEISARSAGLLLAFVVFTAIFAGAMRLHFWGNTLLLGLWPAAHVAIAALLLYLVRRPPRVLNSMPVVWLGKVSYGLYLWQQPFVFGARPKPWSGVLVALSVAAISYYLIERPALRLRETAFAGASLVPGG